MINKIDFKSKYRIALAGAIIYPFVYKIWNNRENLPDVRLKCILNFCSYSGYNDGAARTAISRLKHNGIIISTGDKQKAGYILNENHKIRTMQIKENNVHPGFTLAIFSFNREDEKERYIIRSLLSRTGFIKLAQNTYINTRGRKEELLQKINREGLEKHLFIFECEDEPDKNTIQRLIDIWKINERQMTLNEFFSDMQGFFAPNGLSGDEIFHKLGYAGTVFSSIFQHSEPPVPKRYLPEDYPLKNIFNFLVKKNSMHLAETKDYFIKINQ
jgi:DNA-binding transcriptional regulator PaaX